jgi:pyruvate formate lyase activating enzyme
MLEKLLPHLDLIMYDVKCSDPTTHLQYVGSELETVRKNLVQLCNRFNNVIVRTPVVVGVNATQDAIINIARFLGELENPPTYELLPYHELGNSKREGLGLKPGRRFETPSHDLLHQFAKACQVFVTTIVR